MTILCGRNWHTLKLSSLERVRMIIIRIISTVFTILAPSTHNDALDWLTSDLEKKINIKDDRTKNTIIIVRTDFPYNFKKRAFNYATPLRNVDIIRFIVKIESQAHSKIRSVSDTTQSWRVQYNQRSKRTSAFTAMEFPLFQDDGSAHAFQF